MPGIEDLYREIILDHYRTPRNRGELPVPPASVSIGHNPLCGDEITVFALVEDGIVVNVKVGGQGCSISQSSASMMSQVITGKSLADANRLISAFKAMMSVPLEDGEPDTTDYSDVRMGDLAALTGVVKFPVRIKCATLAWNTLSQAIGEPAAG